MIKCSKTIRYLIKNDKNNYYKISTVMAMVMKVVKTEEKVDSFVLIVQCES